MNIQKVSPDLEKARAFLNRAEEFRRSLELLKDGGEASYLITGNYDLLHFLSTAILAYDGEKLLEKDHHLALVQWMTEEYKEAISSAQANLFDELRKVRNDINYHGQKDTAVLSDFYQRNKEAIYSLRNTLFQIIQRKIQAH